jgi:hypothetical protein
MIIDIFNINFNFNEEEITRKIALLEIAEINVCVAAKAIHWFPNYSICHLPRNFRMNLNIGFFFSCS